MKRLSETEAQVNILLGIVRSFMHANGKIRFERKEILIQNHLDSFESSEAGPILCTETEVRKSQFREGRVWRE